MSSRGQVVGLAVRYVAWWNTQSNVFVGMVRAQRIEQMPSDDISMLNNLCRCHDVLPLLQHRREHDQSLSHRYPPCSLPVMAAILRLIAPWSLGPSRP